MPVPPEHTFLVDDWERNVHELALTNAALLFEPYFLNHTQHESEHARQRKTLRVNGASGEIVSSDDFHSRHIVDRIVSMGIAAHEGQLFGVANQLLGLFTALGLILLSISGYVMWWRGRYAGTLGAPRVLLNPRVSYGLVAIVLVMGIYLPLFGASLLLVLAMEWSLLSRIKPIREWLGLRCRRAEYDPQPPFASGNPQDASAESVELLKAMADPFLTDIKTTVERLSKQ